MDIFKWLGFYFVLLLFQLCNGIPISSNVPESVAYTKLLTGIISLLLTVCCLIFLAACLCCHRNRSFEKFSNTPVIASSISDFDHGHINPISSGEFTIFSPLSPPHFNNNVVQAHIESKTRTVEDPVENSYDIKFWFNQNEKDFPRSKLKYIKELGTGWFGKVVQGTAHDIDNTGQSWTPVVVRILDTTSSQKQKILFLQDAAIYRCTSHTNILSLVGRSLETVPFLLLQEYCPQGDLKGYLQSNKAEAEKLLSTEYPLIWCCQLTSAVKHIHEHNIVHHDLAGRNCQLTSNLTLKLGDYGLGPFKYPSDYYQGLPTVPVRWCAPESLVCTQTTIQPKKIVPESNVWSLGVTMWEICECGEQPYSGLSDDEVISQVLGPPNIRLARPIYSALYTDYIFRVMQSCWTSIESRPTASQIDTTLTDLLQVHRNTTYNTLDIEEFDRRWETSKPNTIVRTDQITDTLLTGDLHITKTLSLSLNNLHGSLDNLTEETKLSIDNDLKKDSLTSYRTSVSDSSEDLSTKKKKNTFNDNPLFQRTTSSGSETEEENWRCKVERGAYTEKVRQKSRSVADLMILTHVDYSESDTETPLPSLDYRVNYKNVRLAGIEGTSNLENANLTFGSEGNLLSIQDTFQEELRKLQEERRDSLPFVPDTVSQNSFSPSRLMQELNSPVDIQPVQVFNIYNVTVDNFSPVHSKLGEIIDLKSKVMREEEDCALLNVINQSESCDISKNDSTPDICEAVNININCSVKDEQVKLKEDNNLLINSTLVLNNVTADEYQHKLEEIKKESSIKEHSIAIVNEILESAIIKYQETSNKSMSAEIISDLIEKAILKSHHEQIVESNKIKDSIADIVDEIVEAATTTQGSSKQKKEQVKKLSEIILGNEDLMQLLSTKTSRKAQTVNFDLSHDQEEAMPNSLTHSTIFTSTPFRKREISLPSEDKYSSINPFSWDDPQLEQDFSLGTTKLNDYSFEGNKKLNYSLETWDNFLGTTLDHQNQHPENLFDSFNSEPQSLLFIDNIERNSEVKSSSSGEAKENNGTFILNKTYNNADVNKTTELDQNGTFYVVKDETFKVNENRTFNVDKNETFNIDLDTKNLAIGDSPKENKAIKSGASNEGSFENGGGWFLHPQQQTDDLTGEIQIQSPHTDSYVGFGIDDEIMSAIRNELLTKLPHAQGSNSDRMREEEEENWDAIERDQVFLRYNVYNTPLSPIPEESYVEDGRSLINSPKPEQETEEPDWSGQTDIGTITQETESNSTLSPMRGTMNRHTPSQDSCCSNDTLFNLEELVCVTTDPEVHSNSTFVFNTLREEISCNDSIINDFLSNERNHLLEVKKNKPNTLDINNQFEKHIPLPSPEDNPWKQLPASLLNFNVTPMKALSDTEDLKPKDSQDPSVSKENLTFNKDSPDILQPPSIRSDSASVENKKPVEQENFNKENLEPFYENSDTKEHIYENNTDIQDHLYENEKKMEVIKTNLYENSNVKSNDNANSDIDSYEDYVNIVKMENDRNRLESDVHRDSYIDIYGHEEEVASEDDNIYGILTDIRFTGPSDNQMMSTSFSENNDEQGWESGSDSRSSSSGEFIWKEGEHEESLKALRAAPQDVLENIKPMEEIAEDVYEESDISSTFTDDEETPEFVPSAWDKFAIPSKSALRSPEKTQKKPEERKSKGVWFKKQKYHCIYEYPKEPESPILQGQDLWKPQTDIRSFSDWEYDGDVYGHSQTSEETINYSNRMNNILNKQNLYQLTSITDYIPDMSTATNADGEFFISSSTQPFHPHNISSQFFPGSSNWTFDSVTPDSGVEDITPGSITHSSEFMGTVPSLKQLASDAVAKKKLLKLKNSEVMGGLRHTRNKLKLDLPPSPSAFTSDKPFTIEHNIEPVIREKPAFTTFGKSRFMVQHVDTPPDETKAKNVSFEALPYTPLNPIIKEPMVIEKNFEVIERSLLKNEDDKCTVKVEVVRGEASLLDSGDEDSGIESTSTLERKITNS